MNTSDYVASLEDQLQATKDGNNEHYYCPSNEKDLKTGEYTINTLIQYGINKKYISSPLLILWLLVANQVYCMVSLKYTRTGRNINIIFLR